MSELSTKIRLNAIELAVRDIQNHLGISKPEVPDWLKQVDEKPVNVCVATGVQVSRDENGNLKLSSLPKIQATSMEELVNKIVAENAVQNSVDETDTDTSPGEVEEVVEDDEVVKLVNVTFAFYDKAMFKKWFKKYFKVGHSYQTSMIIFNRDNFGACNFDIDVVHFNDEDSVEPVGYISLIVPKENCNSVIDYAMSKATARLKASAVCRETGKLLLLSEVQ